MPGAWCAPCYGCPANAIMLYEPRGPQSGCRKSWLYPVILGQRIPFFYPYYLMALLSLGLAAAAAALAAALLGKLAAAPEPVPVPVRVKNKK